MELHNAAQIVLDAFKTTRNEADIMLRAKNFISLWQTMRISPSHYKNWIQNKPDSWVQYVDQSSVLKEMVCTHDTLEKLIKQDRIKEEATHAPMSSKNLMWQHHILPRRRIGKT